MAAVSLIHSPQINHTTLNTVLTKVHGISPSAVLDRSNRNFSDDARALIQLACADSPHSNAVKAIQNSHAVQGHLHYTFLVLTSPGAFEEILLLNTGLTLTLTHHDFDRPVFIVSGSLAQWRIAISVGCNDSASTESREVFNKLHLQFERLGLGDIWASYTRTSQKDGTFRLDGPRCN